MSVDYEVSSAFSPLFTFDTPNGSSMIPLSDFRTRRPSAAHIFHWALLVSTLLPYLVLGLQFMGYGGAGLAAGIIAFVATGHVPATFYLLTDTHIRQYVYNNRGTMVYFCLALLALNFIVFCFLAANVGGSAPIIVYAFMLFYIIWQTWHFAKQNWGVFSFSCICAGRKPATIWERRAIFGGGIAGVLGVYQAAGTGLKVYYSGAETGFIDASFAALWYVGFVLLVASFAMALFAIWQRRAEASGLNTALLLVSTVFFVPYFFIGDALLAFVSFTWAHGLQYLLFLLVHSMSRNDLDTSRSSRGTQRILKVCSVLLFFAFCGWFVRDLIVWSTQFGTATAALLSIQANYPLILNMVVAFLTGITMVHFVWDARIWRLGDVEPRKWVRKRFAFIFDR